MDYYVAITWLLVCGAIVAPYVWAKKTRKNAEKELMGLYETTIKEQKVKINQLYGQLYALKRSVEQEQDADAEASENAELMALLAPVLQKYGIPNDILQDPQIAKTIKKYKHLIPLIARFLPQQPQGFSANSMV
jgi:hypothetical protein